MDLSDEILSQLDVVGVSIHSHFDLPSSAQTDRMIRAMENEHADMVCHPTGQQIQRREPYDLDMDKLLKAAKRTKTVLEVNAQPWRLDLKDEHIHKAIQANVRISIDTDSHNPAEFNHMRWGIGQARRGWATKKDIINTRPWHEMLRSLK